MPKLKKLFAKFSKEERQKIESLIEKLISLDWRNLDIKKLKGYRNVFRVRRGKIRIIFIKKEEDIFILSIDRRREDTYKF